MCHLTPYFLRGFRVVTPEGTSKEDLRSYRSRCCVDSCLFAVDFPSFDLIICSQQIPKSKITIKLTELSKRLPPKYVHLENNMTIFFFEVSWRQRSIDHNNSELISMSVSRFQITIPTHSLQASSTFFSNVIKAKEISRTDNTVSYNFYDHLLRICFIGEGFKPQEHCNHVDKHDVPVPHFGVVLSLNEFHELSERLKQSNMNFIIQPHLRFPGLAGEQYTMFFKDPTGNNLEFKAMTNPDYLFQPN